MNIYETRFWEVFSKKDIHAIRGLFDEAYILTNLLYDEKVLKKSSLPTFLTQTDVGLKDVRPHVLRASIAALAKKFSKKGYLDWQFSLGLNKQRNCRHVEMHKGNKTLYLSRVGGAERLPAKAIYRKSIEMNLFDPEQDDKEDINVFLATYGDNGHTEFMFGKVGIHGTDTWLYPHTLEEGPYGVIVTKHEKEDLLVDLQDSLKEVLNKDEGRDA